MEDYQERCLASSRRDKELADKRRLAEIELKHSLRVS
jgi:hypothetical protein